MSGFQQVAIALSASFLWDGAMTDFLTVQSDVTSLGVAYLEFSCLDSSMGNSFVAETVVYILLPMAAVLAVLVGTWIHAKFIAPGQPGEGSAWTRALDSSVGVATLLLYFLQVSDFELCSGCAVTCNNDVCPADVDQAICRPLLLVTHSSKACASKMPASVLC